MQGSKHPFDQQPTSLEACGRPVQANHLSRVCSRDLKHILVRCLEARHIAYTTREIVIDVCPKYDAIAHPCGGYGHYDHAE